MKQPLVERAFEIAHSGVCPDIVDLRRRLRAEGYALVERHISGALSRQLSAILRQSRQARGADQAANA